MDTVGLANCQPGAVRSSRRPQSRLSFLPPPPSQHGPSATRMKLLFDFLPILLFFVAYKMADIYVATGVLIVVTLAQVGWTWLRQRSAVCVWYMPRAKTRSLWRSLS